MTMNTVSVPHDVDCDHDGVVTRTPATLTLGYTCDSPTSTRPHLDIRQARLLDDQGTEIPLGSLDPDELDIIIAKSTWFLRRRCAVPSCVITMREPHRLSVISV